MSHTPVRRPLRLSWAIAIGLAATTLLQGTATAAEPPVRDQWYLDHRTTAAAPAISAQFIDRWYLNEPSEYVIQARSHRSQEDNEQID